MQQPLVCGATLKVDVNRKCDNTGQAIYNGRCKRHAPPVPALQLPPHAVYVSQCGAIRKDGKRCTVTGKIDYNGRCGNHRPNRQPAEKIILSVPKPRVIPTDNDGNNNGANDNNAPRFRPHVTLDANDDNDDTEQEEKHFVATGLTDARAVSVVTMGNKDYVCGVVGSSRDTGKLKEFYETHAGIKQDKCRIKDCENNATKTGHMYWREHRAKPGDKVIFNYLIPICDVHNGSTYDDRKDGNQALIRYVPLTGGTKAVQIIENPVTRGKAAEIYAKREK